MNTVTVVDDVNDTAVKEVIESNELTILNYFPSSVYIIKKPEYLEAAKEVVKSNVKSLKKMGMQANPLCELYQTANFADDPRMADFSNFVGSTGWNILQSQGYQMADKNTFFESMWCQEHHKLSSMEQHVHPNNGAQLVGFYFIDTPKDCPRAIIYDPRPGKVQISMDETNREEVTNASNMINFIPEPGMLIFTNAWLPHSFTRNGSSKSFRFIHFNIGVRQALAQPEAPVIV